MPWDQFSLVRLGYSVTNLPCDKVASAHVNASMLTFEKTVALGYRRIGFVCSAGVQKLFLYQAGFAQAQSALPEKQRLPPLQLAEEDPARDERQLIAWVKKQKPDAILSFVAEAPAMLRKNGWRIPEDVAYATLSIHDGNADSGIDQHPFEIGKTAVENLISMINHDIRGLPAVCRTSLIEGTWVDGTTLPPRK